VVTPEVALEVAPEVALEVVPEVAPEVVPEVAIAQGSARGSTLVSTRGSGRPPEVTASF